MARARTVEAKDQRRQALLQAALDEFYERGFSAARMDDIAARAGLSKGAIYLYFSSKQDLFISLVESFAVPKVELLETSVKSAGGGLSAISSLMRLAPTILRQSPIPKIVKILTSDAQAFPEMVTAYRRRVVERGLAAIVGVLEAARDAGEIDIDDPKHTARLVVAPIIMSALWRVLFEHDPEARVDLEALLSEHERLLRRALAPRPETR